MVYATYSAETLEFLLTAWGHLSNHELEIPLSYAQFLANVYEFCVERVVEKFNERFTMHSMIEENRLF